MNIVQSLKNEQSRRSPSSNRRQSRRANTYPYNRNEINSENYYKCDQNGDHINILNAQGSSLRSSKLLTHFTNNVETYGSRKIKQRRRNRYVRQRNTSIYNLRLINLPQQSVNDPFINQFFNGITF
ncbi:hypothetical protein RhiirA1_452238 [Rhizophagus irregularis]|uniref:Uncharacterized protein n=2 Tax=Rhizophagus irregularis TaxID=588596 RepID=U9UMB1_RHIID|nr:hypothetical protein GLOIN_2v1761136 [Rhizophagus irregularis DAOM 181602=DAOM 197198]PKC72511.1 hypothetical protein RhiirA1_452238 [Rhizophagus irregularis]PKY24251.1 hypothetical protein RhiirB3_438729 [Rhizophagus irregularis]POG83128.1 hypothetical protein GLOIN_2v1761136 [Rhizophagus irregularis DAOM 181602=DAOM 197198]UZO22395.1 hypothetical protein OCT59_014758 [Rhizophagus irregularis]CAB5387163.1 unnamed protein product [Rhizophagus irregularis]|eukprot:XP_025189994.1 hypothetical protein GLOIN_2v1761136 [Rhizophagus irregularis DAOM 181602=DAOM 197198]